MATEIGAGKLRELVEALRDSEPDPFKASPEAVEGYVREVDALLRESELSPDALTDVQQRFLAEAAARQVRFAHARLATDRTAAIEIMERLFALGRVPDPDGRYDGELVGLSTGLLSDPFFEWLTRIYLPWRGKTFEAETETGDNVFVDNAWSKATGKLGWPEYRVRSDDVPGTIRVFPFRSYAAPGIEEPAVQVLKLDYSGSRNPLPVRRIVDEVVELPGGYILGKVHMRGLREFRRVTFFGLSRAS
jgi:hypothetical protein